MTERFDYLIERDNPYPLGVRFKNNDVIFSKAILYDGECRLNFYKKNSKKKFYSIKLEDKYKIGNIYTIKIKNFDYKNFDYNYEIDGKECLDEYAVIVKGREKWGNTNNELKLRCGFYNEKFDWENDKKLNIPYNKMILYRLHVRGFTKHNTSKVKNKGTFNGIIEKIEYLKQLGINAIELMPSYEFDEILKIIPDSRYKKIGEEAEIKINYWGYSKINNYFAPKLSYCVDKENPIDEFKNLVKTLHKNDIEVIMEICFTPDINKNTIIDCLRYWVIEFHIDGFRINDNVVPVSMVISDNLLSNTKIFATSWNFEQLNKNNKKFKNLAEYNDGFLVDIRKFSKGDENQTSNFFFRFRRNEKNFGIINYLANNNGFTLLDAVSYNTKHNLENGENNADGSMYNYSWNCGIEGKTNRKKIVEIRKKQIKNMFIMLLLSQGTPLIWAGDEFCNTQNGNNNAYCQDNSVSWINWNFSPIGNEILSFVKKIIKLRTEHPILHFEKELKGIDYLLCGYPDISCHSIKAWYPDFSAQNRQLGILLCGKYAKKKDGKDDDFFYIIYNMYWAECKFDLPKLPLGLKWYVEINTSVETIEDKIVNNKTYVIKGRSIVIFRSINI